MSVLTQSLDQIIARINHFHQIRSMRPAQFYGLDRWLKAWLKVPDTVPVLVNIHHGPTTERGPLDWDRMFPVPVFVTRDEHLGPLRDAGKTDVFTMGTVYYHFQRMAGVRQIPEAAGTLAMPAHSTHHLLVQMDWQDYAEQLARMPPAFQPVTVCLGWRDLLSGHHRPFVERGMPVVSAGHIFDPAFVPTLYDIVRRFRYVTGNQFGTCAFVAIGLGIPFFMSGEAVAYLQPKTGFPDVPSDDLIRADRRWEYREILSLVPVYDGTPPIIPDDLAERVAFLAGERDVVNKPLLRAVILKLAEAAAAR